MFARYDIFLSYSRADSDRVAPLRDELRRLGYRVFFDVQSIDPTSPWKERLRQAIRGSRIMVLCWSEPASKSDYINFEYMQAEALSKPICPWQLDKTELPPMLDAQAISSPSAAEVAARLKPILGWPPARRRNAWWAVAIVAAALLAVAAWRILHPPPPPPWDFQGEVTDRVTGMPIAAAEVDVLRENNVQAYSVTDARGRFDLRLPQPKTEAIDLRFRKDGYEADRKFVSTDTPQPYPEDLAKLP